MALQTKAHKIFIEGDEEVVFALDKIKEVEGQRVILVIPHTASISSSVISLKLLAKALLDVEKVVVIVMDDKVGVTLAQRAGFVVKDKISAVDKTVWIAAKELKEKQLAEKKRKRNELLKEREEVSTTQVKEVEISASPVKAEILEPGQETEVNERKRMEDKVVNLDGLVIVAGGDIADHPDVINSQEEIDVKIDEAITDIVDDKQEVIVEEEPVVSAGVDLSKVAEKNTTSMERPNNSLIGKDFTKLSPTRVQAGRRLGVQSELSQKFNLYFNKVKGFFLDQSGPMKFVKISVVVIMLFLIVSYIFFPSVEIVLSFKENEVKVNEVIKASTSLKEVDLKTLTVPATTISKVSSQTAEGIATGKGTKGNFAEGDITLFNNKATSVTLNAGTVVTNITSGLGYTLVSNATVSASGSLANVHIKATAIGANYNIEGVQRDFKVAGYSDTSQVYGRNIASDITGGTSTDTLVVSKEDIESLKASTVEALKVDLLANLNSLISSDDILLEGSEKFKEEEFKSSAKIDDETDKFNIELKMSVTAIRITKTDLKTISEEIVKQKQTGGDSKIDLSDPQIQNVQIAENSITFQLRSSGNVLVNIQDGEIRSNVKGKSVAEARSYLDSLEGLDEYKFHFNPSYIPFFMQRVPNDDSKITITRN